MFTLYVHVMCVQMTTTTEDESSDVSQTIQESKKTYGTPARQLFTCIRRAETEEKCYELIELFRSTMKMYKQFSLLKYFEDNYFQPDRVKQWAYWYRLKMYNCTWKLNTNMHVESWHNILKTSLMGRLKNVRIDKLLHILVKSEVLYYWKWSRTKLGCHVKCDPEWVVMHGHVDSSNDTQVIIPMVEVCNKCSY